MIFKRLAKRALATLLLSMLCLVAFAQDRQITGTVVDGTGESVIGANVLEAGTTNGVITDINGIYNIRVTSTNPVLEASYIGYETKSQKVAGTVVDFIIKESVGMLDEVQVVGYGTQRKVSIVGAQSTIKMEHVISTFSCVRF